MWAESRTQVIKAGLVVSRKVDGKVSIHDFLRTPLPARGAVERNSRSAASSDAGYATGTASRAAADRSASASAAGRLASRSS